MIYAKDYIHGDHSRQMQSHISARKIWDVYHADFKKNFYKFMKETLNHFILIDIWQIRKTRNAFLKYKYAAELDNELWVAA